MLCFEGTDLSFYATLAGSIQITHAPSPQWFLFSLSLINILWMKYVKHMNKNIKLLLMCHFFSSNYKCSQKRLFVIREVILSKCSSKMEVKFRSVIHFYYECAELMLPIIY